MPEVVKKNARRVRRGRSEWRQIIERFEAGDLSTADFCHAEGIGIGSFYQWRGRLSSAAASKPGLNEGVPSSIEHSIEDTAVTNPGFDETAFLSDSRFIELDGFPAKPRSADNPTPHEGLPIEPEGCSTPPAAGWRVDLDLGDGVILRLRRG